MTQPTQAQIEAARPIWKIICRAYQGDTKACATPCLHCDRIAAALTAAAEAEEKPEFGFGPPETAAAEAGQRIPQMIAQQAARLERQAIDREIAATIERCAQVVKECEKGSGRDLSDVIAAIRALDQNNV